MITLKTYLDTRRQKANGSYPIKIRVTQNGKDFLVSTGISCLEQNWDEDKISRGEVGYQAKNTKLRNKLNIIDMLLIDLERKGLSYSNVRLKQIIESELNGESKHSVMLLDLLEEYKSTKTKKNTIETFDQTRQKIEKSGMNTSIDDINVAWLNKFHAFCINDGLAINSTAIHLTNIRTIINYAIDNELTTNYPFRKYSIKKEKKTKSTLSIEEMKLFRNFECEEHLNRYRDYFFLTFYLCGINLVDLVNLKEIKKGRIEYHRAKTNESYSIKVEPETMEILNKYKGNEFLININETYADYRSFNSKLNKWLKKFGSVEYVGKKGKRRYKPLFEEISIYTARRTWATIAAEIGIPDEVISQALGHDTTNPTTAIYINRNLQKIDEANRKVIDAIVNDEKPKKKTKKG